RQPRRAKAATEGTEPAPAPPLVGTGEDRETQIFVRGVLRAGQGEAVPGRSRHEVEGAGCLELEDEARRIGQGLRGRPGAVEKHATLVQPAEIDAHRPRVDTDDAGHRITASAPSTPARRRRWSPRPARGRCART